MNFKKDGISLILIALIFFAFGFLFYSFFFVDKNNTYKNGWEAARDRLYQIGFDGLPEKNAEIKILTGNIVAVRENLIEIKIFPLEPLSDPDLDFRIVKINSNSLINRYQKKGDLQFEKEMEIFYEKIENFNKTDNSNNLSSPKLYYKETIKSDKLKAGQQVTVIASDDIKNLKSFFAEEISILE